MSPAILVFRIGRSHVAAGQVLAAVDRVLGQEAALEAEDRAIARVEARALQRDGRGQDLADRRGAAGRSRSGESVAAGALGVDAGAVQRSRPRRCCRSPRGPSDPSGSA